MNTPTDLVKSILEMLEPDEEKWSEWLEKKELAPVLQDACVSSFVRKMQQALQENKSVFVFGDYDADGILATSIMVKALRKMGIKTGFYIPDRLREGYGLNVQKALLAADKGYQILITVDNGVSAQPAIDAARKARMEVIVTDHHAYETPPECDLFVHPNLLDTQFQSLCGAGVAYELARALGKDSPYMLQLAAVASIADVMEVKGETRAIIQQGLASMNENMDAHLCLLVKQGKLNENSVSFQIVPKLNAAGRLADRGNTNNVVRFFLSEDYQEMDKRADEIIELNETRKQLSSEMLQYANSSIRKDLPVLFSCQPGYHEGIIGLVAGSLMDTYQKPVIVMTRSRNGYKGSLRGPEGFDWHDFFSGFDGFSEFGGHKQAAGFSLDYQEYDRFADFLFHRAWSYAFKPGEKKKLVIDPNMITIENIASLDAIRPFGKGFECPVFVIEKPAIQRFYDFHNERHRKYLLENNVECLHFNQPAAQKNRSLLEIASFEGRLEISEFQGKKTPTFMIEKVNYIH